MEKALVCASFASPAHHVPSLDAAQSLHLQLEDWELQGDEPAESTTDLGVGVGGAFRDKALRRLLAKAGARLGWDFSLPREACIEELNDLKFHEVDGGRHNVNTMTSEQSLLHHFVFTSAWILQSGWETDNLTTQPITYVNAHPLQSGETRPLAADLVKP
ncbi:hypothetical protein AK812_SmicGene22780 [Symbiodinium microadriaticum]|uniref:Uncharacterized protein n=1 Tax=Symbiodinium microadriaticum TaxID=2951 RepID=A0A1Q9DIW4_SYMMI|nr:hypothetical protein AK812_SmicGene22780 [Symbiodinium microadriaticum]